MTMRNPRGILFGGGGSALGCWFGLVLTMIVASSSIVIVQARVGLTYPLSSTRTHPNRRRQRGLETGTTTSASSTIKLSLEQLQSLPMLSWSEDSAAKPLENSYIFGLFETDGTELSASSLSVIQQGINAFLLENLQGEFQQHEVESVNCIVVTQAVSASSRRRILQEQQQPETKTGTQLETKMDVTFRNEPSPNANDVASRVQSILTRSDLTAMLLPEIVKYQKQVQNVGEMENTGQQLSRVNAIYFLGNSLPTPPPLMEQGTDGSDGKEDGGDNNNAVTDSVGSPEGDRAVDAGHMPWEWVIPLLVGACALIAFLALFLTHKHRQQRNNNNDHRDRSLLILSSDASSFQGEEILMVRATKHSELHPTPNSSSKNSSSVMSSQSGGGLVNLMWDSEQQYNNTGDDKNNNDDMFSVEAALLDASFPCMASSRNGTRAPTSTSTIEYYNAKASSASTTSAAAALRTQRVDEASNLDLLTIHGGTTTPTPTTPTIGQQTSDSPRGGGGDSRSVFSFLSGFASKASTVVASNVSTPSQPTSAAGTTAFSSNKVVPSSTSSSPGAAGLIVRGAATAAIGGVAALASNHTHKNSAGAGTPHSRVSSLFTFSEEDSEDLVRANEEDLGVSSPTNTAASNAEEDLHAVVSTAPSDEAEDKNTESEQLSNAQESTFSSTRAVPVSIEAGSGNDFSIGEKSGVAVLGAAGVAAVASRFKGSKDEENSGAEKDSSDKVNVSHVFDNGTDTSKSLDSPNTSLNDSVFASANAVPTLTIDDVSEDANPSWCKDSCTNNKIDGSALPYQRDTCFPCEELVQPAKLSTDEITKELKEAEKESKKLKKMSTNWSMSMYGPTLVESPAAASYSNNKRSLSLPSPTASQNSHFSDPGPSNPAPSPTLIELQWDDPKQAAMNRAKAAAFTESVAGQTKSTASSSGERFRKLTGSYVKNKSRMSTQSAGNADGTDIYQNDAAEQGSVGSSKGSLSFRRGYGKPMSKEAAIQMRNGNVHDANSDTLSCESPTGLDRVRRHAKSTAGDGTTNYQHETMGDWSVEDGDRDDPSVTDSDKITERARRVRLSLSQLVSSQSKKPPKSPAAKLALDVATTPKSMATNASSVSALSVNSPTANSEASASKQLISDLLWLEQKIASTTNAEGASPSAGRNDPSSPSDSLSFASGDNNGETSRDRSGDTKKDEATLNQAIICRDCYAPPGKLKIIIHSTKDGPAVHTVKKGSSLEGHVFSGDLIISVDNVDTRSFSAEQVMKIMTAKTRFERKITVLHFETETLGPTSA